MDRELEVAPTVAFDDVTVAVDEMDPRLIDLIEPKAGRLDPSASTGLIARADMTPDQVVEA
jgi:hypothetical protein